MNASNIANQTAGKNYWGCVISRFEDEFPLNAGALICGHGWIIVPRSLTPAEAVAEGKKQWFINHGGMEQPLYPDAIVELNQMRDDQMVVSYAGCFFENVSEVELAELQKHPRVVELTETDFDPWAE